MLCAERRVSGLQLDLFGVVLTGNSRRGVGGAGAASASTDAVRGE